MSRIHALLTAGALTGLVIVTLFWWGIGNAEVSADTAATTVTTATLTTAPGTPPDMESLIEQNRLLRETVTTLLDRETMYRQQIEAANQQLLAAQALPGDGAYEDGAYEDDGYEDEYEGHEDHEDEEHEQYKREHNEHEEEDDD